MQYKRKSAAPALASRETRELMKNYSFSTSESQTFTFMLRFSDCREKYDCWDLLSNSSETRVLKQFCLLLLYSLAEGKWQIYRYNACSFMWELIIAWKDRRLFQNWPSLQVIFIWDITIMQFCNFQRYHGDPRKALTNSWQNHSPPCSLHGLDELLCFCNVVEHPWSSFSLEVWSNKIQRILSIHHCNSCAPDLQGVRVQAKDRIQAMQSI